MPPHAEYVEAFAGGGAAILRWKRPALANIAIDDDAAACDALRALGLPGVTVICDDATRWLPAHTWQPRALVYADPPYLMETRRTQRPMYRKDFSTPEQHGRLLEVISSLPAMVAISGYDSALYRERLAGWRCARFMAQTRGGTLAEECLWMNYPEPVELHDYRYLGEGFRERERIGRKKARWRERLRVMPRLERYAVLAALRELDGEGEGITTRRI